MKMTTDTRIRIVPGTDLRYTVTRELTGHNEPWWVARFEHHWVGEAPTEEGAKELALQHKRDHT